MEQKNIVNNAVGTVLVQHVALDGVCKSAWRADSLYMLAPAAPILGAPSWGTSALWVHPPAQLCCPKVAPEHSSPG